LDGAVVVAALHWRSPRGVSERMRADGRRSYADAGGGVRSHSQRMREAAASSRCTTSRHRRVGVVCMRACERWAVVDGGHTSRRLLALMATQIAV